MRKIFQKYSSLILKLEKLCSSSRQERRRLNSTNSATRLRTARNLLKRLCLLFLDREYSRLILDYLTKTALPILKSIRQRCFSIQYVLLSMVSLLQAVWMEPSVCTSSLDKMLRPCFLELENQSYLQISPLTRNGFLQLANLTCLLFQPQLLILQMDSKKAWEKRSQLLTNYHSSLKIYASIRFPNVASLLRDSTMVKVSLKILLLLQLEIC